MNMNMQNNDDTSTIERSGIQVQERVKTPKMYVAVVHNDDWTPRAFVVEALAVCFGKNAEEATSIMMRAHKGGHAVISTYTFEVAETKVAIANKYSLDNGRLLLFSVEEA